MRYTVLALCLVALACSKKESPSKATEDKEFPSKAAELAQASSPTIELVTAGKPPLQAIRRAFEEGAKVVLERKDEHTIEMKGGSLDQRYAPSGVIQTIALETEAVSADGTAEVALRVQKSEKMVEEEDPSEARPIDATGLIGSYRIDPQGVISGLTLTPPPSSRKSPQAFDAMKNQFRWAAPPFPEEPIGVGAKWTVTQVVDDFHTQMEERIEVELVQRTDSNVVLKFDIKGTGSRIEKFPKSTHSVRVAIDVRGQTELDPSSLFPLSSTQEVKHVSMVTITEPEPPREGTTIAIESAIDFKTKSE